MTSTRPILFFALLLVGYYLYNAWEQDYGPKSEAGTPVAVQTATGPSTDVTAVPSKGDVPAATAAVNPAAPAVDTSAATDKAATTVTVETDVLRVAISSAGSSLVRADLLAYPVDPKDKTVPVRLFDDSVPHYFVAQSGLISNGSPAPDHKATFTAEKTAYTLGNGEEKVEVPLTWTDASGVSVRKVYIFSRGSYVVDMREEIHNASATAWSGSEYRQLQRTPPVIPSGGLPFNNPEKSAFTGAAWYGPVDKFQKLSFDKFATAPLQHDVTGGWTAMLQHYFFAAWIPPAAEADKFTTTSVEASGTQRYLIRAMSPGITIAPGATQSIAAQLYVGPKLQSTLNTVAPGLALTVDYGYVTVIAEPLHWILVQLHGVLQNWGLSIIALVLLIKLAMFKLSESQYRSMAKMKQFQPRLAALKERYGDDKQKLNAATMELYQKEKINPMGGCLPVIVQMPVFFALLYVLQESVELRQAPFFGWIQNLSAPDPYFILPILNGAAMLATQFLSPAAPGMDPLQARMMKLMPLIFAVMFAFFPAGLVLYWTVNGWLSLLQQWIITRRLEAQAAARAA
jgi:YidC/Oxa1 family membrane protein insertase